MSRPVVIMFFALMAGVALADFFLYDASWLAFASPKTTIVLLAPWGLCLLLTLIAFVCYRHESRDSLFARRSLFPFLTLLFFLSVGFGRYAMVAERQHREWAVHGHPVNRGNPDEFDAVRWQWVSGAMIGSSTLKQKGLAVRDRLVKRMKALGMEEQTMAVVAAMTLGDRSLLRRDTRALFARAGSSHLLALSGLHLGIIVGLFLQLMNGRLVLSRWRRPLGLAILVFIWTFALVAGFPNSLVRASLMTSVFVVANLMSRYGDPMQNLLLTGVIMLLLRPMYLFDVGVQLSFLSVAGILLFYQPLYMWCFTHWRYQVFWLERYYLMWPVTLFLVSLCAQLLTLPLVAYYFHQIPVYGALVSIVMIPLTTLFITLALFLLILLFVWPWLATLLSVCLTWLVSLMMWLMALVSRFPGAVIPDFWSRKAEPQVVVYHNRACPVLHVIASPAQSWVLLPEPEKADSGLFYIRRDFWQRRLTVQPQLLRGKQRLEVGQQTFVMMNNALPPKHESSSAPETIELLWITRGFRGAHLAPFSSVYAPQLLVLDASLPLWQRRALAREAWRIGWRVYDVAEQGAFTFFSK